jgi:hypothetical protein
MGTALSNLNTQRLPVNYKAKKFNHVSYLDVENVSREEAMALANMKLFEINLAGNEQQQKKINAIRNNLTCVKFNCATFKAAGRDKADDILLGQHRRDLISYRFCRDMVYILVTRDKGLIKKFVSQVIQHGAFYKVITPARTH